MNQPRKNRRMKSSMIGVLRKELQSEFRNRYSLASILLFVVAAVSCVAFATVGEHLNSAVIAGVLWVILFFASMSGLARGFVSEEERQTTMYLQLHTTPLAVFFGKLLFNSLLSLVISVLSLVLLFVFVDSVAVRSPFFLLLAVSVGSLSLSAIATVVSAIIAKSLGKGALLPVLSFPLVLPIIMVGVECFTQCILGVGFSFIFPNLVLILSYSTIVVAVSSLLFEKIWLD